MFFPESIGAVSEGQEVRFHEDAMWIEITSEPDGTILSDIWMIHRESVEAKNKRTMPRCIITGKEDITHMAMAKASH